MLERCIANKVALPSSRARVSCSFATFPFLHAARIVRSNRTEERLLDSRSRRSLAASCSIHGNVRVRRLRVSSAASELHRLSSKHSISSGCKTFRSRAMTSRPLVTSPTRAWKRAVGSRQRCCTSCSRRTRTCVWWRCHCTRMVQSRVPWLGAHRCWTTERAHESLQPSADRRGAFWAPAAAGVDALSARRAVVSRHIERHRARRPAGRRGSKAGELARDAAFERGVSAATSGRSGRGPSRVMITTQLSGMNAQKPAMHEFGCWPGSGAQHQHPCGSARLASRTCSSAASTCPPAHRTPAAGWRNKASRVRDHRYCCRREWVA